MNCHRNPAGEHICSLWFVNCQYRGSDGRLSCHRNPAGGAYLFIKVCKLSV